MAGNGKGSKSLLDALLGFVYPESCPECKRPLDTGFTAGVKPASENILFCEPCWAAVERLDGASCPGCGEPFHSPSAISHSPGHRCGDCRADPPHFSRAMTPYPYKGPVAKAIQRLKYRKQNSLVQSLAELLLDDLGGISVDWVMAIPLHPRRLREREFNQSLLLANAVARHFRLPLALDLLQRVRETPPQVGLSKKERKKNMHRAFGVVRPGEIEGRRILLIDDVFTTGATLREGAKTLKKAGAKDIVVAAPARMVL